MERKFIEPAMSREAYALGTAIPGTSQKINSGLAVMTKDTDLARRITGVNISSRENLVDPFPKRGEQFDRGSGATPNCPKCTDGFLRLFLGSMVSPYLSVYHCVKCDWRELACIDWKCTGYVEATHTDSTRSRRFKCTSCGWLTNEWPAGRWAERRE